MSMFLIFIHKSLLSISYVYGHSIFELILTLVNYPLPPFVSKWMKQFQMEINFNCSDIVLSDKIHVKASTFLMRKRNFFQNLLLKTLLLSR